MLANVGTLALALLGVVPAALACNGWTGGLPVPTDTRRITAPIYVRAGEVYDGHWVKYDRNPTTCRDQQEGGTLIHEAPLRLLSSCHDNSMLTHFFSGEKDTAFVVERGGTLRNVIIGRTVGEGVYCKGGGCNLEFVWFEDVCEDAISIVSCTDLYHVVRQCTDTLDYRKTTDPAT